MHWRSHWHRIAGAMAVLALAGCSDLNLPTSLDEHNSSPRHSASNQQQVVDVEIHAVFSGPPSRTPNQINLQDPNVYVQILNVERYLPRRASPRDVRIGESWETGTTAQAFTILDLNNDGNRDVQLRFSTQQLINAGYLGPNITQITVWGRDRTTGQIFRGTAQVEIIGLPPVGGTITGRVINQATGAPVAGAIVNVIEAAYGTSTGPDGRFTIANVPPGIYDLEVYRSDYIGRAVEDVTVVAGETTDVGDIEIIPTTVGWSTTAQPFRGQIGQRYTYYCPPGGRLFTVWGTDVYTDDSSVCVAAVHVGLITFASGGAVTFEMRPGQGSYAGTLRNGVQTLNWGSWPGSFIFPYAP